MCWHISPARPDEYIILGAHYDHLGYGNHDSLAPSQIGQIHPGADDNASGTAGLLELARLFAPLKGQLPRGILFASFAGEELGLLGSAEWVKEPTRPLGQGRRHAEHGYDRPHQGRESVCRRCRHGLDAQVHSCRRGQRFRFPHRDFGGRLRFERPHLVRRQKNSGAVLFLRAACRLPQTFRHLGQNQRPRRGAPAGFGRQNHAAARYGRPAAGFRHRGCE